MLQSGYGKSFIAALSLAGLLGVSSTARADNPVVQTNYTADPAPMVHDGVLYLYTTHDEDVIVDDFFTMNDWRVYSSTDAVNWTDHGSPLHYEDFDWATGAAWAGQVVHRNDRFYFYVPIRIGGVSRIGVGVSDSPIGPFTDALGEPLIESDCGDIDPTVFIDDDEQAYLYWGNPSLCYVRLNEDMISYSGNVEHVPMTTQSWGTRSDAERPTSYEEGPWFYKRDERYYMVFAAGPLPEHIGWSTSPGPTGPWTYGGVLMPAQGGSFTNHPGMIDYKGKSLFFYHDASLPGGGGFHRSVCVEEFTYEADGSIPQRNMTDGISAVDVLNPFARVEAETIAWEEGIETEPCSEGGMNVTDIAEGDYIKVKDVDFGSGADSFTYRVASSAGGGEIELHLDGEDGTVVATCAVESTGGDQTWATQDCSVSGAMGTHDLFLTFGGSGFKFNWWQFAGPGDPGPGGSGGSGGGGAGGSGGAAPMGGVAGAGGSGGAIVTGGASPAGGAVATGGIPGTGGVASTGGSSAAGGSGNGGGTGVGGGMVSTGGAPVGAGGTVASGGSSMSGRAGSGGAAQPPTGAQDSGCGCRVAGNGSPSGSLAAAGMLGLLALRLVRRRARGSSDDRRYFEIRQ